MFHRHKIVGSNPTTTIQTMVIKIEIIVDKKKSYYNFEDENVTLSEVGIASYQLERAKQFLNKFEFESEFEVKENYDNEED